MPSAPGVDGRASMTAVFDGAAGCGQHWEAAASWAAGALPAPACSLEATARARVCGSGFSTEVSAAAAVDRRAMAARLANDMSVLLCCRCRRMLQTLLLYVH